MRRNLLAAIGGFTQVHHPRWVGWLVRYLDIYLFYVYGWAVVRLSVDNAAAVMTSSLQLTDTQHLHTADASAAIHQSTSSSSASAAAAATSGDGGVGVARPAAAGALLKCSFDGCRHTFRRREQLQRHEEKHAGPGTIAVRVCVCVCVWETPTMRASQKIQRRHQEPHEMVRN